MNREIKFRAWNPGRKQMVYDFEEINLGSNVVGEVKSGTLKVQYMVVAGQWLDAELMQYTGLKDRKGKEIYEGDVVTGGRLNCADGSSGFTIKNDQSIVTFTSGMFKAGSISLCSINQACEVVGNVYENSDLLPKATAKAGE